MIIFKKAACSVFIFIVCLFVLQKGYGQDKLAGRIFENKTKVALGGIKIEDLKSHQVNVSDSSGRFSIKASVGDFICFSGLGYLADTLYLTNLKFVEIYLDAKQNMLNEVKIVAPEVRTGSLSAPAQTGVLGSRTVLYQKDADGNDIGGVKLRIFDWDKDQRKKDRDNRIANNEEKQLAIYKVFQAKNLQSYLPIKGVEMDNFIILYTPDLSTYYDPGFNLVVYLNTCYGKFLQMPVEQRQSETAFRLELKSDAAKH